jgi:hypothetical protein
MVLHNNEYLKVEKKRRHPKISSRKIIYSSKKGGN